MLSAEYRESLGSAAHWYHLALAGDWSAQSYLRGRGIADEVAAAYRLGVVDGTIPEHASYKGWICIPYITRLGGVVQLKFRRLDGGEPKYMGSGGHPRLYNTLALDVAEQMGYVAICEGEFDAMILDICDIPAVGIPGVDTWASRPEWREIFTGFSRVLVFADQDEPGRKLANRILRDLDTAHVVNLPAKDVNQAYLESGADKIREAAGL